MLIYSSSLDDNATHLRMVLGALREYHLFAKRSKCAFAISRVEYLGHFISPEGVSTDPTKLRNVEQWPTPKTLK